MSNKVDADALKRAQLLKLYSEGHLSSDQLHDALYPEYRRNFIPKHNDNILTGFLLLLTLPIWLPIMLFGKHIRRFWVQILWILLAFFCIFYIFVGIQMLTNRYTKQQQEQKDAEGLMAATKIDGEEENVLPRKERYPEQGRETILKTNKKSDQPVKAYLNTNSELKILGMWTGDGHTNDYGWIRVYLASNPEKSFPLEIPKYGLRFPLGLRAGNYLLYCADKNPEPSMVIEWE